MGTTPRTRVLLVGHGRVTGMDDRLIGRTPGVGLNPAGWLDASRAATSLEGTVIDAIFASPQPRAIDTALAIAALRGMAVEVSHAFDEMHFGAWVGLPFSLLEADPRWRRYTRDPARTRPPGGESMAEVQARALEGVRTVARRFGGRTVAVVTHAEVIRCLTLAARPAPLDDRAAIAIAPASVTELAVDAAGRLSRRSSTAPSARRSPRTRRATAAGAYGWAAVRRTPA